VKTTKIPTKTSRIKGGKVKEQTLINRIEIGEGPGDVEPKSAENDENGQRKAGKDVYCSDN
jgi:hypothetical protein